MTLRRLMPANRRPSRLLKLCMALAGLIVLFIPLPSASAHHLGATHEGPPQGLAIPNLTHGQMAVIAANQSAILKLADEQFPTDPVMRRLRGYVTLQSFACFWGLVPGGVTDENSPFNECTHAYLAGTKALLLHLLAMPGDRAPVRALADKIELEMLQNNASLALCRYSDERFDTAEILSPHWGDIPFHPISLLTLAGAGAAAILCVWLAASATKNPARNIGRG